MQPSEAFRALRDGQPSEDPAIEARRALFDDIFARLDAVGVPRSSVQLAWDYSTASMDSIAGRLVAMREDAFARLPTDGKAPGERLEIPLVPINGRTLPRPHCLLRLH